jgi:hypothetical protein
MGIYPKALNTRSLKSYVGFHRNQQTLSLIPWGVPKSETLKSHHRRRGCVLGQGATKKSKKGKGKEGKSPHTTWQIRRWFAVDNLYPETDRNCRNIPGSARRKWPAATRSDVMRFTEYSTPWLVCAYRILRSSQRGSIGSERKNSTPPSF